MVVGAERAAVNGDVRADFDVVADDDAADLRHLAMHALVLHVTEAVRADDRAGMDAHAAADLRLRIKGDVRKNVRVLAELRIGADVIAALQNGARADADLFADHAIRPDVRGGINLRGGRNDGRGMNARGINRVRKKQRQHPGESDARVGHADQNFFGRREITGNKNGGSGALLGALKIGFIFGEGKVAGPGAVGGSETGEDGGGVPADLALELFGNFSGGKRHNRLRLRIADCRAAPAPQEDIR